MNLFFKNIAFLPAMALSMPAVVALAADSDGQPHLLVTGQGEARQKPDRVILSFGVTNSAKDIKQAQEENARRTASLLSALKKNGVDEKNIKTTYAQIGPRYDYVNGKQQFTEYVASKNFSIRLSDIENYGRVLQAALGAGASQMGGVEFDSSHRKEMEHEALTLAVQDAEKKADTLAAASGRKRGEAFSIESTPTEAPPRMFQARAMSMEAAPADQLAPGEITVNASVQIKYKLQ